LAGRFLKAFQPIIQFIPEIKAPERRVSFSEKLLWTAFALIAYLVMSEIPLYGLAKSEEVLFYRVIFASSRGTLMELGIGPIVTAGLILQLLAASGFISVDFSNPEDRSLFSGVNKVFAVIMTIVQASAYLIGGFFGSSVTPIQAIVIFTQLIFAGIIVMLLDEMIQKGWGIGSGISLFIIAGVAQRIMVDCFSMVRVGNPAEFRGIFPAIIEALMRGQPVSSLFIRAADNPSILGLISTVAIFIFCIYAQGVRVEIPIAHSRFRGFRGRYPISLLYVSNLPVIFASALFGNIYIIGQILWSNYRNNPALSPWVRLIGDFEYSEGGYHPIGGLAYYVSSPRGFADVLSNPLRYTVYLVMLILFCLIFSWVWLQVGGLDPKTVAKQLVDAGMQVPGFRRSEKPIEEILKRYIPTVTLLGGLIVGLLAAVADLFGAFGTGTGILLSVGIIYQYYQQIMSERIEEIYPGIKKFLGR
jgi:preprotein translocase subunit SecY/protein transport protein SEC61 subunit alpha